MSGLGAVQRCQNTAVLLPLHGDLPPLGSWSHFGLVFGTEERCGGEKVYILCTYGGDRPDLRIAPEK